MADRRSTRHRKKLTDEHYGFIDMAEDDKLSAVKVLLQDKIPTRNVS